MLTGFDAIETRAFRAQQRYFGTCFDIIPMKSRPNKRPVPDRARDAQQEVIGTKITAHRASDMDKSEHIDRAKKIGGPSFTNVSGKGIQVEFLYCDLAWMPRQHDVIVERATDLAYEIIDSMPSGHSSITFQVTEIEGPYSVSA